MNKKNINSLWFDSILYSGRASHLAIIKESTNFKGERAQVLVACALMRLCSYDL
jgi:hypothetical protein